MSIEIQHDPEQNQLRLNGSLTIYHASEVKAPMLAYHGASLDLSGIEEMDGAGLQLLLLGLRDASLQLVAASEAVLDVLALSGLQHLLTPGENP